MPGKGKRKVKSGERSRCDGTTPTSDDDSYNDNCSVISNYSENRSTEDYDDAELLAQEQLEDKIVDMMDGCSQKSSQGRVNCIRALTEALTKKYMPIFVKERVLTICDIIEKSLKKGGDAEKSVTAELSAVLCVQLGLDETANTVNKVLLPILMTIACDKSVSPQTRAKCCSGAGGLVFLCDSDVGDTLATMQQLEAIFATSYLKGDGSAPNLVSDVAALNATALNTWSFLLTTISGHTASLISSGSLPSLEQLATLLESPHLDIRMGCGEALALIFEDGRRDDEDYAEEFASDVCEVIKNLATDSHKYRAKRDRKQQRATFRDVLKFIEEDVVNDVQVKFGKEVLILDTLAKQKQYDEFCNILGSGINTHLRENEFLRDIFDITAPIAVNDHSQTQAQNQWERCQKRLLNAANFKARTLSRGKNRDKRADF